MGKKDFYQRWGHGQTTIEFAVLIMIIIGALIAAQVYFKRGIQGRWKASVDEIAEELYDPRFTDSNVFYRTASNSVVEVTTIVDATLLWTMRTDETNSIDTRSGTTLIGGYEL